MPHNKRAPHNPDTMASFTVSPACLRLPARPAARGARRSARRAGAITLSASAAPGADITFQPLAAPSPTAGTALFEVSFEAPNEYGYFPSAIAAGAKKRAERLEQAGGLTVHTSPRYSLTITLEGCALG